jgi:hypothetical protein
MRSAHGAYPIYVDDDTTVAFVEFVHTRGMTILRASGNTWSPQVYASLIQGARNFAARKWSDVGVSRMDSQAIALA